MTSDAVIEAAAKKLSGMFGGPVEAWLADARAFADDGLLVDELPVEPLPDRQVRIDPDGVAWQRRPIGDWTSTKRTYHREDDDVRDWPVLVPEADLNDLRAERDRLADKADSLRSDLSRSRIHGGNQAAEITRLLARVSELEATEGGAVDAGALARELEHCGWCADDQWPEMADAIREHLPAATRPVLPERHIAVNVSGARHALLEWWAEASHGLLAQAGRAELDRRAKAGEES